MPSKRNNNERRRDKNEGDYEILGIVLVIISAFILLCIVIRPILGIISRGIFSVTTGIFGLFSYPLFLSTLLLGIALIQGRRVSVSVKYRVGIALMVISLMLILQLATTHSLLKENFSSYISGTYARKTSAGGVLFGVIAYAVQSVVTPVVSYIVFSLAFVCSLTFFILLPVYGKRRSEKKAEEINENPFVKGIAKAQQTKPMNDNSLFVDTIRPTQRESISHEENSFNPLVGMGEDPKPQKSLSSKEQEVKFEPYTTKQSTYDGFKTEAHKILFGDRKPLTSTIVPPVSHEPESNYTLPPLVSSPVIKDTTAVRPQPQPEPKPEKRVHNPTGLNLDVPAIPPKDFENQIVGGLIINGDEKSRQLAEELTPLSKKTENESPKVGEFSTKKIELTSVSLKETQENEELPKIVNGDYFGANEKTVNKTVNTYQSAPIRNSYTSSVYEKEQETEKEEPIEQEPVIVASDYENEHNAESRFLKQLSEDRKNAERINSQPKQVIKESAAEPQPEPEEEPYEDTSDYFTDKLSYEEEDESLIADELPQKPRKSSFNIIDEPVDLSEQSHFDGNDNTGYYSPMSIKDIKPVSQPVVNSNSQLKIDDYVANVPTPAPKPKKKKRTKYIAPDIDMLISSDSSVPENFNVACEEKARMLESTLQELKLPVKVTGITRGPAVTRFELEMPPGIPIKRIEQFSTDIEYYLASNGKIRIEAPIPGKRAVGIEVPNEEIDIVRLREIIESKEFQNSSSPLTLSLGKDIAGSNIICNLEKMPHLLIAGATGSGKSACLNSIIISILYKASPEEVRLILIDPKRVEFNMYQGIPHLLGSEIINDAQQAINVLTWAKEEMDRRYTLFGNHRVRNLPEFNKSDAVKTGEEDKLPYIVLIVDELAELMLDNNKKVLEGKIMSIAQKARAAGIHLILATQRPSVDVITGTIKANLPSRIAFSVKSIVDSRTILDECGAETLLGRGDMLYSPVGMDDPKRVQGAFVTDKEVMAVSEFVRENNEADFDEEFTSAIAKRNDEPEDGGSDDEESEKEFDSLMPEVLKCVIESGSASTSMIQRRFSVGYARASRIIDQMELHKFIGPLEGSKPRAVYISREQYKELFGIDL